MLVKKSSSQPSSPAATESSQTSPSQFPFTFPSQPVRVPSSPCFTTEIILHPNSEFVDQLTIDGKILILRMFHTPNFIQLLYEIYCLHRFNLRVSYRGP